MRTTLISLFLSCIVVECQGQCSSEHPDYDALVTFYEDTSVETWNNSRGWAEGLEGSSCDPCNFNGTPWHGLACLDGRVTFMELINNNLVGTLDSTLVQLEFLEVLDLSHNDLTGTLHNDIFKIDSLVRIDLSDNKFTGIIPTSIGNLKSLIYVDLSNNDFNGCFSNTHFNLCPLGSLEETAASGYNFNDNPQLAFLGDFTMICAGAPQRNAPCNDGNNDTIEDTFSGDCTCKGLPSLFCDNLNKRIGDACDDNNKNTLNDFVQENCSCTGEAFNFYVPNIITTDSQEGNDIIAVFISIVPRTFSFQLFNRWGGIIYTSHNHMDQVSVSSLSVDVPSGVYVYQCKINDSFIEVGTITIVN